MGTEQSPVFTAVEDIQILHRVFAHINAFGVVGSLMIGLGHIDNFVTSQRISNILFLADSEKICDKSRPVIIDPAIPKA